MGEKKCTTRVPSCQLRDVQSLTTYQSEGQAYSRVVERPPVLVKCLVIGRCQQKPAGRSERVTDAERLPNLSQKGFSFKKGNDQDMERLNKLTSVRLYGRICAAIHSSYSAPVTKQLKSRAINRVRKVLYSFLVSKVASNCHPRLSQRRSAYLVCGGTARVAHRAYSRPRGWPQSRLALGAWSKRHLPRHC